MSRFNAPTRARPGYDKTENLAGGEAFTRTPRLELATLVLNSLVQDTFYESAGDQLERLAANAAILAASGDLKFCAQAAVYTRKTHGMRSISHALAGEVAFLRSKHPEQRGDWGGSFYRSVVDRLDDMPEIASYWLARYAPTNRPPGGGRTLPAAMKRGFAAVMENAKPHLLAKWNGASTRSMTLRQLAHLVHPRGPEGSTVWKLRAGTLESADTHEVAMTRAGKAGGDVKEAKTQEWLRLFEKGRIKYLAALRNCRRIVEDSPEAVPALCRKLTSPADIRGSKVFPFQLVVAAAAVAELNGPLARDVLVALSQAVDLSVANVPEFEGTTLVALDDSYSMTARCHQAGNKGQNVVSRSCLEMGALFAAITVKRNRDCDLMFFANDAVYITLDTTSSTLSLADALVKNARMQGTNWHAPFETANRPYDRIILLSDEQGWMGYTSPEKVLREYERRHACKPFVYPWNLAGSKTGMLPEGRVRPIAGFSQKVFDLLRLAETDPQALVNAIQATEI